MSLFHHRINANAQDQFTSLKRKERLNTLSCAVIFSSILGFSNGLAAADNQPAAEQQKSFMDGWNEGKIEAVYLISPHLNNFTIDADVREDHVILKGKVKDGIDRELAEAIALGMDGIKTVDNQITLAPNSERKVGSTDEITFAQRIKDATTTAKIKTNLLASKYIGGMAVNVDTHKGVVTLNGTVGSREAKDLAIQLALNTEGVERVQSNLEIKKDKQ